MIGQAPLRLLLAMAIACGVLVPVIMAAPDPGTPIDACKLLGENDIEPLLFGGIGGVLDSWSNHAGTGVATCRWEGWPKNAPPGASPRVMVLSVHQLADAAAARADMAMQPHKPTGASLALSGQGDDAVILLRRNVTMARHGAVLATVDAGAIDLADQDPAAVRYLLEAASLKAAGAAVGSPPWTATDSGTDAARAKSAELGENAWTPPPNPHAITATAVTLSLRFLILIARHWAVFIVGGIVISIVSANIPSARDRVSAAGRGWWLALLIIGGVVELIFGNAIADRLLHRFGVAAAATIVGQYDTSTQYNSHNVVGYHVMIRKPDGGAVATSFEDDDFNVYPPHNATTYPEVGDVFTVRYMAGFPGDFAILSDDGSPWAKSLRCARLREQTANAERKSDFSREATDRQLAEAATMAARKAGCRASGDGN